MNPNGSLKRGFVSLIAIASFSLFLPAEGAEGGEWKKIADGLLLMEFAPAQKSSIADYPILILKIDPFKYRLRLLSVLEQGEGLRTCRQWCEGFGLVAAINASMYQGNLRSTGYMRNYDYLNNPAVNPAFGAFLVFNPKDPSLPRVGIVDARKDKEWRSILERYDSVVQNYRLISNGTVISWPLNDNAHSIAAIGMDEAGHVLFIQCRAPYSTHDFIKILLSIPIGIKDAMYLEGGNEASLCLHRKERWDEWSGFSEIATLLDVKNGPKIPNIIGIAPLARGREGAIIP